MGELQPSRNLDSGYKEMIACHFEDAMNLVRPEAAACIDWDQYYEILDTECRYQIGGETKTFVLDSLIRVQQRRIASPLLSNFRSSVIINNEFEAQQSADLVEQADGYRSGIIGRFGVEPYQILWLTDGSPSWKVTASNFYYQLLNRNCDRPIEIVKVMDYQHQLNDLFAGQNVAAWTFWMTIRSHETMRNMSKRLGYKNQMLERLISELESSKMTDKKFRSVTSIMDSILTLPNKERRKYEAHMNHAIKMKGKYEPLLTDFERDAMAKGEAKGEAKGKIEGKIEGLRDSLKRILKLKFSDEGQSLYEEFAETPLKLSSALLDKIEAAKNVQSAATILSKAIEKK